MASAFADFSPPRKGPGCHIASMTRFNRRRFLMISAAAAGAARLAPAMAARAGRRRVLTLVYDKGLGMMRAVDRLVP